MKLPPAWLVAISAFALTAPAIILQRPFLTAKAKLILPRKDIDPTGVAQIINLDFSHLNRLLPIDTALRFTSFEIVRNTLSDLKMPADPQAVEAMQRHIRSRLVAGTNLVEIQAQHHDAG